VHAFATARIERVPRVRLGSLVAFFFLAFALLLSAEEAEARLLGHARFADAARAIGVSEPAFASRAEDISPCTVQPVYPAGSLADLFSRPGLLAGFAAGFLGAGVFGFLFGHGLIGELSGLPSILGLVSQFALLLAFGWLVWAWWRADKAAAVASPRQLADAYERDRDAALPGVAADTNRKSDADGKNSFADKAHLSL
jgi:hypothetical protein